MSKPYTKIALGLMALAIVYAIFSFWRENWSASDTPGALERFIANLVLSGAHGGDAAIKNPVPPSEENLQEGRRLYEKQCVFCHGKEGKGQGPTGPQFYPPAPSLLEHVDDMSDGQMQAVISRGIRYTAMPSFYKELNPEEIWKVVWWVRRLPQTNPAGDTGATEKHAH